jgi:hypothetical protein
MLSNSLLAKPKRKTALSFDRKAISYSQLDQASAQISVHQPALGLRDCLA